MRIGHGFDVHRFESAPYQKECVVLGGVTIPFDKGLVAHSDGDVVLHALCDALLGACALGDIGQHFPDTALEFKNIDSRILLRCVVDLLTKQKVIVVNADLTAILEKPKLQSYIPEIKKNIAEDLKVTLSDVNIKATTTEGLDATGEGLGIAAHAVVLVKKI